MRRVKKQVYTNLEVCQSHVSSNVSVETFFAPLLDRTDQPVGTPRKNQWLSNEVEHKEKPIRKKKIQKTAEDDAARQTFGVSLYPIKTRFSLIIFLFYSSLFPPPVYSRLLSAIFLKTFVYYYSFVLHVHS